ncbi:hypothetical protein SAMN04487981_12936 [Streptomyces sp. cf386]|uniref:hypothetical protein n=1 Tax=Streptomyces sp. cf386 TaxID=1761904 RepID=UPI000890BDCD|nr:hypothetical protein [Streptomyces sp. cf386]SDP62149.1 hypothetical protein SAMN04487981_12936 [Streptomyces sp. cf386]
MTAFAIVGLVVLGIGNASTTNGANTTSPEPPVTYPIRFEHSTNSAPRTAVPRPTVSYPVKFDIPALKQPAPTPSVSYPIDFSALGGER